MYDADVQRRGERKTPAVSQTKWRGPDRQGATWAAGTARPGD